MSLEDLKNSIAALVFVALIIGALMLALDSFQDDMGSDIACEGTVAWYNDSSRLCCANASTGGCNTTVGSSFAFNATLEGLEGGSNAANFLSTIGTLIGVSALIGVVVVAFLFARR